MIAYVKEQADWKPLPKDAGMFTKQRLDRLNGQANGEKVDALRTELQRTVQLHAGVFRTDAILKEGVDKVLKLYERAKNTEIGDKSMVWNTARIEALELDNLMEGIRLLPSRLPAASREYRADLLPKKPKTWLTCSTRVRCLLQLASFKKTS